MVFHAKFRAAQVCMLLGLVVLFFGGPLAHALTPGDRVPEFVAPDQDGKDVKLSDFRGKHVLLFFYPKDETPGCTKEACVFRDEYEKFRKIGAVVIGISVQDGKSHQEFRTKHKLPYPLLVDAQGEVAKKLGVSRVPILGWFRRQSALISSDGVLVRFYSKVEPETHAAEVLRDLEAYVTAKPSTAASSAVGSAP